MWNIIIFMLLATWLLSILIYMYCWYSFLYDDFFAALGRASSARERSKSSVSTLPTGYNNHQVPKQNGTLEPGELADNVAKSLQKAALYVLGEKNHVKVRFNMWFGGESEPN